MTDTDLDLDWVRSQFPAFTRPGLADWAFFENAGGSYPCAHTVDALNTFYLDHKMQPYGHSPASAAGGAAMDRSRERWAVALGVATDEVVFGPSTTANTYVLAQAFAPSLGPGRRVIVTNQDHEANTGAIRRAAEAAGADVVEWRTDPSTGLLDTDDLAALITPNTALLTMGHCSNIVGVENDVARAAELVHAVGGRIVVDGVSFVPHGIPDVGRLGADVYLFSLYKVYSVHQGLMTVRADLLDELPNQGHFFNAHIPTKRLAPAGPDHAQEAAAGAVLDYVEAFHAHHGGATGDDLAAAVRATSDRWQQHEASLLGPMLETLSRSDRLRLIGPASPPAGLHRCPTVAVDPRTHTPDEIAAALAEREILAGAGHFYAHRVLSGLDVDPERGVLRMSFVHYTSPGEIGRLLDALDDAIGGL